MSAAITDKITDTRNAARPNSARATGTRSAAGVSLACDNLAGWPTASKVHFVTYQVNSSSVPVAGSQLDCTGIVSGNSITSFNVIDGTDLGNSVGDYVEMLPTAAWGQDLSDVLTSTHNRSGGLKTNLTIPSPTIADLTNMNHTHASTIQGGVLNAANALLAGSVSFTNLLSTIFSGQVTTYTNGNTAGGTNSFFYINLGGIKLFWGTTATLTIAGTGNQFGAVSITLPGSFFNTIQTVIATPGAIGATQYQSITVNSASTSTISFNYVQTNGTNGSMVANFIVIGT